MKIFVNDSKGVTLNFDDLSDSTKVKDLKKQIIKKGEIFTDNIEIMYNGYLLADEEELCFYGIQNMSYIVYVGEFHAGRYK